MKNSSLLTHSTSDKNPKLGIPSSMVNNFNQLIKAELGVIHLRVLLAQFLLVLIPIYVGGSLRAKILSLLGFKIGDGTVIWGMPKISGCGNLTKRLSVGKDCWFNVNCFIDLGAPITIGDRVCLGQEVMLMTTSHRLGNAERRCGEVTAMAIQIGNGVWIGARSIILPGVTIHDGAVVGAGAVVVKDVLPNTMVGGVPAKVIRTLLD